MTSGIELLTEDLTWMETYHDSEDMDHPGTIQPGMGRFTGGEKPVEVKIDKPHTLMMCPGLSMVHVGDYGLIQSMPPPYILAAMVNRFWLTPELGVVRYTTLDGLVRWCEAAPPLTGATCPNCKGKRLDPRGRVNPDDPEARLACQRCDGNGIVISNFEAGLDKIGVVNVDRRLLLPVLKHLRGDEVALGVSRSVDGGAVEAHIRPFLRHSDKQSGEWGDWRIQLDDFVSLDKLIQPA